MLQITRILVRLTIILKILMFFNRKVMATLYTKCYITSLESYVIVPLFTSECTTVVQGVAKCICKQNCNLISRNRNQCSFFSKGSNSIVCNQNTSGNVRLAKFTLRKYKWTIYLWKVFAKLHTSITYIMMDWWTMIEWSLTI